MDGNRHPTTQMDAVKNENELLHAQLQREVAEIRRLQGQLQIERTTKNVLQAEVDKYYRHLGFECLGNKVVGRYTNVTVAEPGPSHGLPRVAAVPASTVEASCPIETQQEDIMPKKTTGIGQSTKLEGPGSSLSSVSNAKQAEYTLSCCTSEKERERTVIDLVSVCTDDDDPMKLESTPFEFKEEPSRPLCHQASLTENSLADGASPGLHGDFDTDGGVSETTPQAPRSQIHSETRSTVSGNGNRNNGDGSRNGNGNSDDDGGGGANNNNSETRSTVPDEGDGDNAGDSGNGGDGNNNNELEPCDQCVTRGIVCKGPPRRGCNNCRRLKSRCSRATLGKAKKRAMEDRLKQYKAATGTARTTTRVPTRAPTPGPSRQVKSSAGIDLFDDLCEEQSEHESEVESDRELAHLSRVARTLEHKAVLVEHQAAQMQSLAAAMQRNIARMQAVRKGKGKRNSNLK